MADLTKNQILKILQKDTKYINTRIEKITQANLSAYPITTLKKNYPQIFNKKSGLIKTNLSKIRKAELINILNDIEVVKKSRQLNITEIRRTNRARIKALRQTLEVVFANDKKSLNRLKKITNKDFQFLFDSGLTNDLLQSYGSPRGFDLLLDAISAGVSIEKFVERLKEKKDIFLSKAQWKQVLKEKSENSEKVWKNEK